MTDEHVAAMIRSAIGGDTTAMAWVVAQADLIEDPQLIAMAALLERRTDRLDRAAALATTSRERQVVDIARARLHGQGELVDAFVRDHLVEYPDSLIVAWIASGAVERPPGTGA